MVTYDRWIKKRILITVRTYPVPSRSSIEVSCTAGIDENGHWIRLFPVPYRFLDQDKRFRKYQRIEANVTKAESDPRPESYKIDIDSITIMPVPIIPTSNNWEERKVILRPLTTSSLCYLQSERDQNKEPTLGFFKPRTITGFKIEPTKATWSESDLTRLRQYSMFGNIPKTELQKLPYVFSYDFKCSNPSCRGHELMCTDWELGASFWSWRYKYGSNWETKFRNKYETEMILGYDTHFFVGTLNNHPSEWIIIGLFYPPK
jgi:hypothetical protein